jgi:ubiquinol-cytochrome c reductase cytochrome b subunit
MMWTDGLIRMWPAWEFYIGHHTIPQSVWIAILMGLVFVRLIVYPFLEKRFSGDHSHHNLLQRPRDVPVRTSVGAMAIAFYIVLTFACMNDIIAYKFHISLNATTWIGRIGMIVLPPFVYFISYRWCVGLQRSDRAVLEHGIETGIIKRLPHGAYIELHQPLGPVDDHGHPLPLEYQGTPVRYPRPPTPPNTAPSPHCGSTRATATARRTATAQRTATTSRITRLRGKHAAELPHVSPGDQRHGQGDDAGDPVAAPGEAVVADGHQVGRRRNRE